MLQHFDESRHGDGRPRELTESDLSALDEMHVALSAGGAALLASLRGAEVIDLEAARAREIAMNALEARLRRGVLESDPQQVRSHLAVLKLADAYEATGNQIYRLCEVLAEALTMGTATLDTEDAV